MTKMLTKFYSEENTLEIYSCHLQVDRQKGSLSLPKCKGLAWDARIYWIKTKKGYVPSVRARSNKFTLKGNRN